MKEKRSFKSVADLLKVKRSEKVKEDEKVGKQEQANNPLHGVKLQDVLEYLEEHLGWEEMALEININCFKKDPSIRSSLKFLRKTQWAREEVEQLYLELIK